MTNADKITLDYLELKILPLLEHACAPGDRDHARSALQEARDALASLEPCLQVPSATPVRGQAPVVQNANVMRRAQEAQRRLRRIIAALNQQIGEEDTTKSACHPSGDAPPAQAANKVPTGGANERTSE